MKNRNRNWMTRYCIAIIRIDGGIHMRMLFSSPLRAAWAKIKSLLGLTMRGILVPVPAK